MVLSSIAVGGAVFGRRAGAQVAAGQGNAGISRTAASIHQEVNFNASRTRVYDVLTSAAQFDKVVRASAAMKSGLPPDAKPTEVSRQRGGAFLLFGGYISGRNVVLIPNQRLVQAWRADSWPAGVYSIVRFELTDAGAGTRLVFDHTGFPPGEAQHLADGWRDNYWTPMAKVLA
ncbi:MAG TPA: SRPBCC domain-containing protein [Gemmatimonadaceae bacterium]